MKQPLEPNDILCQLQNVGTDSEAQIVEDLAIKAGFWWKCSVEDCDYVNCAEDATCGACHHPKERTHEAQG